jgi:all-trans-8'-apo-beta-carotenal 15,15'-oxygenase
MASVERKQRSTARLQRIAGHLNGVARAQAGPSVQASQTASLWREDVTMESDLMDDERRALDCKSEHEREAWLKFAVSCKVGDDEKEYFVDPSDIEGQIPEWLDGSFIRTGPGLFEVGGQRIHMADADGYNFKVSIRDGKVHCMGKYNRTDKFVEEQKADKILFRQSYGNSQAIGKTWKDHFKANVGNLDFKITGNTNQVLWADKMFALHEVGKPIEIDPVTFETLTPECSTLNGILSDTDSYSAHFCIDQVKNTIVNFGFDFVGKDEKGKLRRFPRCNMWEIDDRLNLLYKHEFDMCQMTNVHDMVITENYIVMMTPPVKAAMMGLKYFLGWGVDESLHHNRDPEAQCVIYVIPRFACEKGGKPNTAATVYGCINWWPNHHCNAWETPEGDIVLDSVMYDYKSPAWHERGPFDLPRTQYVRYAIPHSKNVGLNNAQSWKKAMEHGQPPPFATHNVVYPTECEMPIINPKCFMRPHRYTYLVDLQCKHMPSEEARVSGYSEKFGSAMSIPPWSGLLKLDMENGAAAQCYRPGGYCGEVAFVPHPNAVAEDDGVLLFLLFKPKEMRSYLQIFDAKDITKGAIASIRLNSHIPFSFHVGWYPFLGPKNMNGGSVLNN